MTFRLANVAGRAALVRDEHYYDLEQISAAAVGPDPMQALAEPERLHALSARLVDADATGSLAKADLGAPVPAPRNCYGIGLNYGKHVAEADMELPEVPMVFTKFPSCIVGPNADVRLRSDGCDYEGELVAVIGTGGSDIAEADAWDHVIGLTVGQDISDRPAQFMAKPPQFALGKSFDTFGPMGPVLVSTDSFDDPTDLALSTLVNGEVRQDDRTSSLIFGVATLVSFLSRITTLRTGDVIFTGTPDGVGVADGRFLVDGDVVTTSIEGIGTMNNRCVRVSDFG
ncbi:MAG: fumarylacetoacetate hydrolase family protein [Acidimicrobiia bacterium]|nr:fumarylacetoacetate hydrolase family protein [Acidimicrobiia bacterium]MDH5236029.1 fumarylacetoacetate hydrolase family protein [Acidimicrobiia bacterium]